MAAQLVGATARGHGSRQLPMDLSGNRCMCVAFSAQLVFSLLEILPETIGIRAGPIRGCKTIRCTPLASGPSGVLGGPTDTSFYPGPGDSSTNLLPDI